MHAGSIPAVASNSRGTSTAGRLDGRRLAQAGSTGEAGAEPDVTRYRAFETVGAED